MLLPVNQSLTTGANVSLFQSAVVCVAVLAICGCDRGQPADFKATIKAAARGDAVAQYKLGAMYDTGQGVPQDYAEALKWYRLSADQGDAMAQFNLGLMYENGHRCATGLCGSREVVPLGG